MLINLAKKVTTVTPADKKETDVKVFVNLIFLLSVYIFRKILALMKNISLTHQDLQTKAKFL